MLNTQDFNWLSPLLSSLNPLPSVCACVPMCVPVCVHGCVHVYLFMCFLGVILICPYRLVTIFHSISYSTQHTV